MLASDGVADSGFESFSAASGVGAVLQQPQQLFGVVAIVSSLVCVWSIGISSWLGGYEVQTRRVGGHYTPFG